ncbi:sodium:calcium antiporter [Halosegnis rubeus]|uniref:Sodium:calcium antiporter n=1 Tax=Halosegnis rubeus TaxID=2212850 RepID=A0A5N5UHR6_9EURY|nr:sodium:calcium antiporter [Halosegnis rubeus]KAB7518279.1 sodium:calcium antiporter [Halosegnis rubeus]KAB7519142.1 sodium:calcium antiporter [Halosegnis rubeus]
MFFGLVPATPPAAALVIAVTTAIIWLGSGWLERSADELAAYYGLPAVVQGSVVVAVGSSFPELASVVITALSDSFSMGVGAIVGSAIFNILVIPALAGVIADGPVSADRTIVYKEAQFYMIAVSALVITFALGVIYYPTEVSRLGGQVTRPLAAIPLALYGLYLFIQWQDVSDHEAERVDDIDAWRSWGLLALGLGFILLGVESLVGAIEVLNASFGIPEFLAGVTILAAATSLPDALVSVRAARGGDGITSLGNVLGSNTFDLLVAIPVGVLIAGTAPISFAVAAPMFGVLTVATILLFTVLRTDLTLTGGEAYLLAAAYLAFVGWVVAETLGATSVIVGV